MEDRGKNFALPGQARAQELLVEIEGAMLQSQRALLGRRLAEFEKCTARLKQLSHELREVLAACKPGNAGGLTLCELTPSVSRARDQGRLLRALLRRTSRNLETLRQALTGCSQFYGYPEAAKTELHL
jgi:hypothetical protein